MSTLASVVLRDITANRPAASIAGRLFFDTTLTKMQRDNGSSWDDVAETTGGAANLQAASYKRTSANYTTTSTTFVDVDATNLALTITTGARRCLVGVVGSTYNSGASGYSYFDIDIDGAREGGTAGLLTCRMTSASHEANCSFTYLTAALTAASHTFKLQWRTAAGTSTLLGSGGYLEFFVAEQYLG